MIPKRAFLLCSLEDHALPPGSILHLEPAAFILWPENFPLIVQEPIKIFGGSVCSLFKWLDWISVLFRGKNRHRRQQLQ